ncbi:MAG: methylthioribulose 1-phosphate dehydratase [Acidobacteria bacterium]|nr:MAG: methylthioribulose 1-phosphate dehydratase [Acidobacteriota bacterium]REJ99105.1 MAG: methylthioribulose 1-phosphate dehydratase [Acidobacteriota bacterium]REK16174.1 MAG: methylthioribulose 1-phosphate dehydratase [Acidobacteriota bacterium]REK43855.1 MAG: methylthioribulose 1-phosphate dehydratase [Acidobacteriota bacterium]
MDLKQAGALIAEAASEFYRRGWVLGTSGNFSAVLGREPLRVCITSSGKEKGSLGEGDFLEVDSKGNVSAGNGRPSAETSIHIAIYNELKNCGAVFHTHSVWGNLLSDRDLAAGAIAIEGQEMLKGLAGVVTHEHREEVPVIANSQDYGELSETVRSVVSEKNKIHGIYLHRHGLYTWGNTIADAKRHIEIFEFLFEVTGRAASSKQ